MTLPRPRVVATREAVFAECDRLFAANTRITAVAIQTALRGGSPNVVYRYIDEWYAQHRQRFLDLQAAVGHPRPPGIPDSLWEAITPAWDALTKAATASLATALHDQVRGERDAMCMQLGEVDAALATAEDRLARLNAKGRATPKALAEAQSAIQALQRRLASTREALERQARRLKDAA